MGNLPFFNVGKVQHLITEFCFFLFEVLLAYCICNFYAVLIFFGVQYRGGAAQQQIKMF